MLSIERHKQFHKDFSTSKLSEKHFAKFIVYLAALIQDKPLPHEAHDHELEGEWKGFESFISAEIYSLFIDEPMMLLI
jgi:mRNA interferase YafQ